MTEGVSETLFRLDTFFAAWRAPLCDDQARVTLTARPLEAPPGLHFACADAFVTALGHKPIGVNWELLDAEAEPDGPRSACAALAQAFRANMVFSNTPWLGEARAGQMAREFIDCFDPSTRQIVTNRMYFGWHPITTASIEWAFVAFDDTAIALLLATDED